MWRIRADRNYDGVGVNVILSENVGTYVEGLITGGYTNIRINKIAS